VPRLAYSRAGAPACGGTSVGFPRRASVSPSFWALAERVHAHRAQIPHENLVAARQRTTNRGQNMKLRARNLERLDGGSFDVLIVGGGINGAVSAACLSARGAKVALIDRGDFAGQTSQNSSNLAWGGIKYLESYELGLVRKLCVSRNHLIRSYPSTVKEIRFFVAHEKNFRHGRLKLFFGSLFYWLIGSFFTAIPRLLSTADMHAEEPVVETDGTDGGFEYSDAYLYDNDARFVWSFVRGALDHGAAAANYVESTGAKRVGDRWVVQLRDGLTGRTFETRAKVLVNAGGPWVDEHNQRTGQTTTHRHAFSKGIHLIVPRITDSQRVLTFFADDGRLFFVIPMGSRTCVGTTDTKVESPESHVTDEDRAFVLENINKRLRLAQPLTPEDVIAERCGVRPLATKRGDGKNVDWMQMSRKHAVDVNREACHLSIFGGKLTDCVNVGEEIATLVSAMGVSLPYADRVWYGEPPAVVRDRFFHQAKLMELDDLTSKTAHEPLSQRLWRRYGLYAFPMLEAIRTDAHAADLYIEGAEYTRCEIEHAARNEMVTKLDDFLRRRSKIAMMTPRSELFGAPGLSEAAREFFGDLAEDRIAEYFENDRQERPTTPPSQIPAPASSRRSAPGPAGATTNALSVEPPAGGGLVVVRLNRQLDHSGDDAFEHRRRIGADPGVGRRALDDRAPWRDEPVPALAAGQEPERSGLGTALAERAERGEMPLQQG
jgi:glycerol-3-phosphate dehydrogenase